MLEIRNLVKIYKPKKGVPVKALDNVSLVFPQKGMVFLLGKSGSGKSTLLNVLGGLDRCNSGDILIQGKSTKSFRQSHFDSYRNTYVGFIFQEYNILEEFSVGTNIALALQLQGLKPDSQKVNEILKQVDLEGYGNRKPNELSGGQKQRVAIARALVKNPKIIMADEPTGALDSMTGRQILTTLKKLSRDKLVIVVSHDREFAEQYADRIIELADGQVIRDVEQLGEDLDHQEAVPVFMEDSVSLPESYELTDDDREAICDYIQKMVSIGKEPKFTLFGKQSRSGFQPTDMSRIQTSKEGYKLIKSRLPLKYAFKLGASGLKHKKFRLVMTILLSCIAMILFGLADTVASYDYVNTAVSSLTDPENQVFYAAFEKEYEYKNENEPTFSWWEHDSMSTKDLDRIREQTGLELYPVYNPFDYNASAYFDGNIPGDIYGEMVTYYRDRFGGYIEIDEEILSKMGATLVAGKLPAANTNEVAISTVILETFQKFGYRENWEEDDKVAINDAQDLIGKTLTIADEPYVVCGIVDTGLDMRRFHGLRDLSYEDYQNISFVEQLGYMALEQELSYCLNYSLAGLAMVGPGQVEQVKMVSVLSEMSWRTELYTSDFYFTDSICDAMRIPNQDNLSKVVWLDGKPRTELKKNEIILGQSVYMDGLYTGDAGDELDFERLYNGNKNFSAISKLQLKMVISNVDVYAETVIGENRYDLQIVGIIPMEHEEAYRCFISRELLEENADLDATICQTLSAMPENSSQIRDLVEFTDKEFIQDSGETIRFNLMNPVTFELRELDEVFKILRQVFFWVGLVFVIFASLLFSNFIATSISYKKQEIGILRAIGSRSNDVFRIFFAESFCIAMINYVISLAGTIGICVMINNLIKNEVGLLLTVLNVGIRQVLLLLGICLLTAAAASFLPVRKIAAKRPIDAIRDR